MKKKRGIVDIVDISAPGKVFRARIHSRRDPPKLLERVPAEYVYAFFSSLVLLQVLAARLAQANQAIFLIL